MPRMFFAVQTPSALREELEGLQQEIAYDLNGYPHKPSLRPERLQNSHCTLRFLGDVDQQLIAPLISAVQRAFDDKPTGPCLMSLTHCGVFPNSRKAKVLWVGVAPEDELRSLRKKIDEGLEDVGVSPDNEKDFHAHLTLFRFKEPFALPRDYVLPSLEASSSEGEITEVVLIESELLPGGPRHEVRARFALETER